VENYLKSALLTDAVYVAADLYTGCTNNPLVKSHYLSYCNEFFHQIYSLHTGGFRPHIVQILLQHLL